MRHYQIGTIEKQDNKWILNFLKNTLYEEYQTKENAFNKAREILIKFVNFAKEGASFRIIDQDKTTFYLADDEGHGLEEFEASFAEWAAAHFFYMDNNDLKYLALHPHEQKIKRSSQADQWAAQEIIKGQKLLNVSWEKINKKKQQIISEMEHFVDLFIKKHIDIKDNRQAK